MIEKEVLSSTDTLYNYYLEDSKEFPIGYLEVRLVDEVLDIINVYVNEEHRRKGYAKKLFEYCFNDLDYSRAMLEVNENNFQAINLYNNLGFKEISMRDKYYGQDTALIMEKIK